MKIRFLRDVIGFCLWGISFIAMVKFILFLYPEYDFSSYLDNDGLFATIVMLIFAIPWIAFISGLPLYPIMWILDKVVVFLEDRERGKGFAAFSSGEKACREDRNFSGAITALMRAIKYGDGSRAYPMLADCLEECGRNEEALIAYNKAIDANKDDCDLFFMRSNLKKRMGDMDGCIDDLQEAIRLSKIVVRNLHWNQCNNHREVIGSDEASINAIRYENYYDKHVRTRVSVFSDHYSRIVEEMSRSE